MRRFVKRERLWISDENWVLIIGTLLMGSMIFNIIGFVEIEQLSLRTCPVCFDGQNGTDGVCNCLNHTTTPTYYPTDYPTQIPLGTPTQSPTESPTQAPTITPTVAPTNNPTESPTQAPTKAPTSAPTNIPTESPTESPTQAPTKAPTGAPTNNPTNAPTKSPTKAPTQSPTTPTNTPTPVPTFAPTSAPTENPGRIGQAQYVYTANTPNNNVSIGQLFTCNISDYNGLPLDVIPTGPVLTGTAFFIPYAGTFRIDYQLSLNGSTVIALYGGASTSTMTVNTNTYVGTSTATTWTHGTWIIAIPTGGYYVGLGTAAVGTSQVARTGNIGTIYMIRVTFNKYL